MAIDKHRQITILQKNKSAIGDKILEKKVVYIYVVAKVRILKKANIFKLKKVRIIKIQSNSNKKI